jgi:hypothetical protein
MKGAAQRLRLPGAFYPNMHSFVILSASEGSRSLASEILRKYIPLQ